MPKYVRSAPRVSSPSRIPSSDQGAGRPGKEDGSDHFCRPVRCFAKVAVDEALKMYLFAALILVMVGTAGGEGADGGNLREQSALETGLATRGCPAPNHDESMLCM